MLTTGMESTSTERATEVQVRTFLRLLGMDCMLFNGTFLYKMMNAVNEDDPSLKLEQVLTKAEELDPDYQARVIEMLKDVSAASEVGYNVDLKAFVVDAGLA